MSATDRRTIIYAYRHLYRQGLKVVNYSTPSRHVLLQTLRSSFRSVPAHKFDQLRVSNTLSFLERAAEVAGIEHKIVKNLLMLKYWDQPRVRTDLRALQGLGVDQRDPNMRKDVRKQLNKTLMLLNESLGTCLL
ncbi:hypothetical protein BJX99DRAFT_240238 [Aspergillus californicus]